jgi:hypothetical protein
MSVLSVSVDRPDADAKSQVAIVQLTAPDGAVQSKPCRVSDSGVNFKVHEGIHRVDLRLPNGHREQKMVTIVNGGYEEVVFTLPRSDHEYLGLQTFVSHRARNLPGTKRLMARSAAMDDIVHSEVRIIGGSHAQARSLNFPSSARFAFLSGPTEIHTSLSRDAVVLHVSREWLALEREPPTLIVPLVDQTALSISFPPFSRFDIVLSGSDAEQSPLVDSEVIVEADSIAALLGYLSRGDYDSTSILYDTIEGAAERALYDKYQNPGLAVVGGHVLVALGRFVPGEDSSVHSSARILNWLDNLAKYFEFSDGPILWATAMMQSNPGGVMDWFDPVRLALVNAAARRLPVLSQGVELWLNALVRIEMLQPVVRRKLGFDPKREDPELVEALARARWVRERLCPREIFTTLLQPTTEIDP